jgi:hypothetical protein
VQGDQGRQPLLGTFLLPEFKIPGFGIIEISCPVNHDSGPASYAPFSPSHDGGAPLFIGLRIVFIQMLLPVIITDMSFIVNYFTDVWRL